MSVAWAVHDGDTVHVQPEANLSIRFLAIDTPEVSFQFPGTSSFVKISDERWATYLSDLPPTINISPELREYLASKLGPDCAQNHATHAEAAHRALERIMTEDLEALNHTIESFKFFLAFAYEALDTYGRLLAYVHPNQPNTAAEDRLDSYNFRMLEQGLAVPYFIFPNIDPFRSPGTLVNSVEGLHNPGDILTRAPKLREAREAVQRARAASAGVFNAENPLRLSPFELRMLARAQLPNRFLINLGNPEDNILHPPGEYFRFVEENRLWIPEEFVPLFQGHGWN